MALFLRIASPALLADSTLAPSGYELHGPSLLLMFHFVLQSTCDLALLLPAPLFCRLRHQPRYPLVNFSVRYFDTPGACSLGSLFWSRMSLQPVAGWT
ncbi:hypothetical protein GE09DRAFT_403287 [Coniochaeta sp. 2T2.1]|nr:hypothetical protein GE09DRAFT_403287 [Coniochaeta sp. 2T2.1]